MTPQELVHWGLLLSRSFADEAKRYYFKDSDYDSNQLASQQYAEMATEIEHALKLPGLADSLSAVPALVQARIPSTVSEADEWKTYCGLYYALRPIIKQYRQDHPDQKPGPPDLQWIVEWCRLILALPVDIPRSPVVARTLMPGGDVLDGEGSSVEITTPESAFGTASLYNDDRGRFLWLTVQILRKDARPRRDGFEAMLLADNFLPPTDRGHSSSFNKTMRYSLYGPGDREVALTAWVDQDSMGSETISGFMIRLWSGPPMA